jgi:hypothetical protein
VLSPAHAVLLEVFVEIEFLLPVFPNQMPGFRLPRMYLEVFTRYQFLQHYTYRLVRWKLHIADYSVRRLNFKIHRDFPPRLLNAFYS